MTRGATGKPKTLGRLIFGEKRKQHSSPSRHRSSTRNGTINADLSTSATRNGGANSKSAINLHDWAVWRMQLNEQMASMPADRLDAKHMRQYLQTNHFYQQHSRDPSTGRYNGGRLLFSIPHAKIKPDFLDRSQDRSHVYSSNEISNAHSISDDRTISVANPTVTDHKTGPSQSKPIHVKADDFLRSLDSTIATETSRIRLTARNSYTAADRVHSTLQKAVKDGNVLEKIKAFEMQAAAAQAESSTKVVVNGIHHRVQTMTPLIPAVPHRAVSPTTKYPTQHPTSPVPPQSAAANARPHRGRHVHPTQHSRDQNIGPAMGQDLRKGAHVLEPAHGDIILKRRTPSQKTINDEDYSTTLMSSIATAPGHGHHRAPSHHHHHHPQQQQQSHHRRTSASRSRHRRETSHDARKTPHKEKHQPKSQSKQKESTKSSSSRYRWLKGRKETPTDGPISEDTKPESSPSKSKKSSKNKKKNAEEEKTNVTSKSPTTMAKEKASSADNNRVYGVPNLTTTEESQPAATSTSPIPQKIDEEITKEEINDEKDIYMEPTDEEDETKDNADQAYESTPITKVERRMTKAKLSHQKLSSTDGDILDKVDEEARFSRPTDDHAHRSELNDEDEECKSEGDVFIEEPLVKSATNIGISPQQSIHLVRSHSNQSANEKISSERRWHWSKESGGLIDKGNRKKKSDTRPRKSSSEEPLQKKASFQIPTIKENDAEKYESNPPSENKESKSAIGKRPTPSATDEFFENGPHTNPEETIVKLATSS